MLQKIKDVFSQIKPKLLAILSAYPFVIGLAIGYVLHMPISWILSFIRLLLKI